MTTVEQNSECERDSTEWRGTEPSPAAAALEKHRATPAGSKGPAGLRPRHSCHPRFPGEGTQLRVSQQFAQSHTVSADRDARGTCKCWPKKLPRALGNETPHPEGLLSRAGLGAGIP